MFLTFFTSHLSCFSSLRLLCNIKSILLCSIQSNIIVYPSCHELWAISIWKQGTFSKKWLLTGWNLEETSVFSCVNGEFEQRLSHIQKQKKDSNFSLKSWKFRGPDLYSLFIFTQVHHISGALLSDSTWVKFNRRLTPRLRYRAEKFLPLKSVFAWWSWPATILTGLDEFQSNCGQKAALSLKSSRWELVSSLPSN